MPITPKTYIIAEAGVNHNGSIDLARQLIDIAVDAGADAVKFQSFKAEKVVSANANKADYQKEATGEEESQLEMIKNLELSEEAHAALFKHCKKRNIDFLSTPFDSESLDFLVSKLKLNTIKIPSGEITNAPFLLEIARTQKPVILSTGMSTLGEVEMALSVLAFGYTGEKLKPSKQSFLQTYNSEEGQQALKEKVTLLHCTTEYPAPFSDVNLRAMDTLREAFSLPVGLSDHTMGFAVPIAAVARGAVVIEKHFTLDRNLPGPDHRASLEPDELKQMIKAIRQVEEALGSSIKKPAPSEVKNLPIARKSIVAAKPIAKRELFSEENLTVKRSGNGLAPVMLWELIGNKASKGYQKDEPIEELF